MEFKSKRYQEYYSRHIEKLGGIDKIAKNIWINVIDGWSITLAIKKVGINSEVFYDACKRHKEFDEIRKYCLKKYIQTRGGIIPYEKFNRNKSIYKR